MASKPKMASKFKVPTVAPKPNFPNCEKCTEIIQYYFNIDDMARHKLYKDDRKVLLRQHAVSVIAKVGVREKGIPTTFVPYLAMNYFDRFLSHYDMKLVEGRTAIEKVRLIAISCFTLSCSLKSPMFHIERFLTFHKTHEYDHNGMDLNWITYDMVMTMRRNIMDKLKRMKPVTAFWFLDHFYAHFVPLGLKRRSINEIIVQAQGEHTFVDFMPSDIAFSACVAAATIACPLKELPEDINNIINNNMLGYKLKECLEKMIEFCRRMNILIEVAAEEIEAEKQSPAKGEGKGKEVKKVEGPQPQMERGISWIEPREEDMLFELKWATDVPPLEEEDVQPQESTAISLRIPGTKGQKQGGIWMWSGGIIGQWRVILLGVQEKGKTQ
ncbi:putative cyclin-D6-1 [Trifolium repens]|nr:putative cyclin-D6-1 [Trifolium repens]